MVEYYMKHVSKRGYLTSKRKEQSSYWMYETIREGIYNQLFNDPAMKDELKKYEKAISEGQMTSFMAAASLESGNSGPGVKYWRSFSI